MDLPLEACLEPPAWSPSESHSPDSDILEELHPWAGEVKFSSGDIKAKNLFEGVPFGLPLPVSANLDYTMVGTRKRKGWDDDNSDNSEPPSSKISRDQLLLSDCLDNINTDSTDLTSVDNALLRGHKRDAGSTLSRSSWPMRDLGDNLAADLDGLGVDTYNISEAFLNLPSLTVFKQEAPSPSPNENGVAHMSPLSLAANLDPNLDPESSAGIVASDKPIPSPLHHLLQVAPAVSGALQSPSQECSPGTVASNAVVQEAFFQSNQGELTLPIGDCRFQYVLAAATSIATKVTEETLTYLNQGQSYEIKLKKLGDLSNYRGRVLKSVIRICFHDRRLQYMEREQITAWQASRPGERIVEVDVPLSYGAFDISQDSSQLNTVEFLWDATKEVGVYIKVNCISTEFTPKKHGGEKGVPFRIQIETFLHGDAVPKRLHAAACQIKVFKLKGADRKHKQDREKIMKRPMQEQDKFQPSYDCTVLTDISNEAVAPPMSAAVSPIATNPGQVTTELGVSCGPPLNTPPISSGTVPKEEPSHNLGDNSQGLPSGLHIPTLGGIDPAGAVLSTSAYSEPLLTSATDQQTSQWLQKHRFGAHLRTFNSFCGADLLRLTRDDLIQICGLADGIRLFNALHSKSLTPALTIYLTHASVVGDSKGSVFRALYLNSLNCGELSMRLAAHVGLSTNQIAEIFLEGPGGIRVLITNEVVQHMKNEGLFTVELCQEHNTDRFCLLLKPTTK